LGIEPWHTQVMGTGQRHIHCVWTVFLVLGLGLKFRCINGFESAQASTQAAQKPDAPQGPQGLPSSTFAFQQGDSHGIQNALEGLAAVQSSNGCTASGLRTVPDEADSNCFYVGRCMSSSPGKRRCCPPGQTFSKPDGKNALGSCTSSSTAFEASTCAHHTECHRVGVVLSSARLSVH
jgi:hypothetical protein